VDGESPALQLLQRHLAGLAPGEVSDIGKFAACWPAAGINSRVCTASIIFADVLPQ
jgi:hypothetical protein